jgi:tetratricopeptide (TPR) repeat protein
LRYPFNENILRFAPSAALIVLLALTWWLYSPGLRGSFLLDDIPALQGMQHVQNVGDAYRYILSGTAGPLGRPLSLASFFIDADTWPSSPSRFKRTNLLLHLLTGLSLAWLSLLLCRVMNKRQEVLNQAIAIVTMALWLLHPFNVSTTLYIVQRMAQLSTLFIVIGLLCYVHGRMIVAERVKTGYSWMTAGIVLGGLLAILSKENGLLIIPFALAIEYLFLRKSGLDAPIRWNLWAWCFLFLPLLIFASWVTWRFAGIQAGYEWRDFSMGERLLTESRVLFDYLRNIIVPVRQGTSIFHDDYAVSRSLLDPVSTLFSLAGLLGLGLTAFWARNRLPVLAFAISWFFIGHLLESTIFSLELYFEHRNYLAMFGILFAMVYYVFTIRGDLSKFLKASLIAFGILTAGTTAYAATLWGRPLELATIWALENPGSYRSQQNAANLWLRYGNFEKAEEFLQKAAAIKPDIASSSLQLASLRCLQNKEVDDAEFASFVSRISQSRYDTAVTRTLENVLKAQKAKHCVTLTPDHTMRIVRGLQANPDFQDRGRTTANLYVMESKIHNYLKDYGRAAEALNKAYRYNSRMDYALKESRLWARAGKWDESKEALLRAKNSNKYSIASVDIESKALTNWEKHLNRQLSQNEQRVR